MRKIALLGVALAALLFTHADAQQICCSGGGGGGSVTYPLTAPNGSSAAPSYSFTNGTDSGMFANANGSVTIVGSKPSAAAGGGVALTGGAPTAGNNNGGAVTISSGQGIGAGVSGGITIQTANAPAGATALSAGSVSITAGNGTGSSASANAGSITLTAGNGNGSSNTTDGAVTISTGTGNSGGVMTLTSGPNGLNTAGLNTMILQSGVGSGVLISSQSSSNLGANLSLNVANNTAGHIGSVQFGMGTTTGPAFAHLGGVANAALTSTGNGADVTEDTLQTYSLPANALDQIGRCVRVTSWGTTANNADTKTLRLRFGGTLVYSQTLTTSVLGDWVIKATVCKTAANTQTAYAEGLNAAALGTASPGIDVTAPGETDTSAIVIKTTGQAGTANANDIVCTAQIVEFLS